MKKTMLLCILMGSMLFTGCGNVNNTAKANNEAQQTSNQQEEKSVISFECKNSKSQAIRGQIEFPKGVTKDTTEKLPVVIMSHGVFDTRDGSGQFVPIANKLNENGFITIKFDFDGYRESEGSLVNNSVKTEMDDLSSVIDYVKTLNYVNTDKINLLGFSMGGAVTSLVAGERPNDIHSVALWEPAACLVDNCAKGILMDAKVDVNNIPDEIPVFNGQYVVGKAYFQDAIGLDIYGIASKYDKHVLVIHGDNDQVVPLSYAEKYKQVYKNADLAVMSGGEHVNKDKILDRMVDMTVSMFVNENK